MKVLKTFALTFSLVLLAAALLPMQSRASEWNKRTIITTTQPLVVPGKVLQPGTYVLKLQNSPADRHIVQIFNQDESRIEATVLAMPNYRLQPTDNTRFSYWEMPAGQPQALKAWFYPGDDFGQEFAYPQETAATIARTNNASVPTVTENNQVAMTAPNGETQPCTDCAQPPAAQQPSTATAQPSQPPSAQQPSTATAPAQPYATEPNTTAQNQAPVANGTGPTAGTSSTAQTAHNYNLNQGQPQQNQPEQNQNQQAQSERSRENQALANEAPTAPPAQPAPQTNNNAANQPGASTMAQNQPPANQQAQPAPAPAPQANQQPPAATQRNLPRTASPYPLVGLAGLFALGAALVTRAAAARA